MKGQAKEELGEWNEENLVNERNLDIQEEEMCLRELSRGGGYTGDDTLLMHDTGMSQIHR